MDGKYCLQSSFEANGSKNSTTDFDVNHNPGTALATNRIALSPLTNLRSRLVKVLSFLFGLTFSFYILASYILTPDPRGLLLTPPPYQKRPSAIIASALPSSKNNFLDMKSLMMNIISKLEYTPRRVPDKRKVIDSDPHLFATIPRQFLPHIKNPCWLAEFSGESRADPYEGNMYFLRATFDQLRTNFQAHLCHRDGKLYRLRCLPYVYIIGQPKCGTTDLFSRLLLHEEVTFTIKEPHWWTRKRFGYIHFGDGQNKPYPVEDYLDLFDRAAHRIQEHIPANSSKGHDEIKLITGDASASTMWDNQALSHLHEGKDEAEPLLMVQDFIHTVQPNAKIIIILRDPLERLYSDYLYFNTANKSMEEFHQKVVNSMKMFQSCLLDSPLRYCVYNASLSNAMPVRLHLGMYIVFLLDWLTVFQSDQILVVRLEDYSANIIGTIKKVYDFLNVGPLSKEAAAAVIQKPKSNTRRVADSRLGPMLNSTRSLLSEFYRPFNVKLAHLLENEAFLWT